MPHLCSIYSQANQFEKAYQCDRKTLEAIRQLEKQYKDRGRYFRNYDSSRYVIYQRILSNHTKLSQPELEKYYKLAMQLVAKNPEVAETNRNYPGPQI